ncbi:MAG: 4Fe-4S binding protein, partial [Nitrospirota bacterium]
MNRTMPPEFRVKIDQEKCRKCKRCLMSCSFGVYSFADRVIPDSNKCVACNRCVTMCPEDAITIQDSPNVYRDHPNWPLQIRKNVWKQ